MATVFTHTVGVTYHTDAGTITSTTDTYTGDGEENFIGTMPPATSNQTINIALDVSTIKSLVLNSTKDLTLKTNSTGAPIHTINLLANKQVVWNTDRIEASPLATTDVTKFFASCTDTAVLRMSFLLDDTP